MEMSKINDNDLLQEIDRRFKEKQSSIEEMEFMTKKLLKLNEANRDSQEAKSQFLSLIKNEFNNPMSSLLNITNILIKKVDDPAITNLSQMMKMELLKLDFSLKNIFSASEIEAGETANDYSIVNIKEIVDEVISYFSYLVDEKSLHVKYICNCDSEIISDAQKINIILLNLISNACEYSYENSTINVIIDCDDTHYSITVEDSGEGISQDHAKNIYNRFSHFESGQTRRTAGLGLGLSVTRGMAEALEGSIDNITKDGKTIFIVSIPKIDKETVDVSQGFGSNEFMFDNDDGMVEF